MEDHVKRVVEEQRELNEKIGKLTTFTETQTFGNLPPRKQQLLTEQLAVMNRYSVILGKRLAEEGVPI